jgi:hypothetical protein
VKDVDEIRRQMAEIRRQMHVDVTEVVETAEEVFDWKNFIRNAPWLWVGAAFAVGYFVVPRRRKPVPVVAVPVPTVTPETQVVEPLVRTESAPVRKEEPWFSPWKLLGQAVGFAAPMALNFAKSYASALVEQFLQAQGPSRMDTEGGDPYSYQAGGSGV